MHSCWFSDDGDAPARLAWASFLRALLTAFIAKMLFLDTIYAASPSPPKASLLQLSGGRGAGGGMKVRRTSPNPSDTKPGSSKGITAVTFRRESFIVPGFWFHTCWLLTLGPWTSSRLCFSHLMGEQSKVCSAQISGSHLEWNEKMDMEEMMSWALHTGGRWHQRGVLQSTGCEIEPDLWSFIISTPHDQEVLFPWWNITVEGEARFTSLLNSWIFIRSLVGISPLNTKQGRLGTGVGGDFHCKQA